MSNNLVQLPVRLLFKPLSIVLFICGLLLWIATRLADDLDRAGVAASVWIVGLLYYGHFSWLFTKLPFVIVPQARALIIFGVLILFSVIVNQRRFWKVFRDPGIVTKFLNVTFLVILVAPAFRIIKFAIGLPSHRAAFAATELVADSKGAQLPDIYYLIVDGYARADVLETVYHYDNTEFIDFLIDRGFYVASQSRSNYMQTALSLSSSLNFDYLDEATVALREQAWRVPTTFWIAQSRVRKILEQADYQFVALSSGYFNTEIRDADVYLSPYRMRVNEFDGLLLGVSAARFLAPVLDWPAFGYEAHREIIHYAFAQLYAPQQDVDSPKFVFMHVVAPHPPFVFDEHGRSIEPQHPYTLSDGEGYPGTVDEYLTHYVGQLKYVNRKVQQAIDAVLENSDRPVIIILQADHGPGAFLDFNSAEGSCWYERFGILNAYYFPDDDVYRSLYETISPVNSFRVVLDAYFDTNLGLLEDRSYYSSLRYPYDFTEITESTGTECDFLERE